MEEEKIEKRSNEFLVVSRTVAPNNPFGHPACMFPP